MTTASVNEDGTVTVPKEICEKLGLHMGASVEFVIFGRQLEMLVQGAIDATPPSMPSSGYGMLKSNRPPAPVDFDPAAVLK
jgi:bifunctional DNA-binding transcriptional regulator/antitoxin component of YhaV-PrlF toxin-antitoxin module